MKGLRVHDRPSLSTLTSFMVNQGIVSFFDQNADSYFTNTFLFTRFVTRLACIEPALKLRFSMPDREASISRRQSD